MRSFKSINEEGNWQRLNKYGATYTITFQFRGQTKFIQMFFPQRARPLKKNVQYELNKVYPCLLYTSPSPRDLSTSRMPSSA